MTESRPGLVRPGDPKDLAGRVAVVTGSSRNIGRAIALELASAGAAVMVNARTSAAEAEAVAEEIRKAGGRAAVKIADVADPEAAAALIAAAVESFGRLDILVNNAAVRREIDFAQLDYREWREIASIILDGAYLCSHSALPHLIASGSGAVVNIGGVSAFTGAAARAHVIAAKAGLAGLTRALAHDLAPHGITVNCVVPGRIDTTRVGKEPAHHGGSGPLAGRRGTARGNRRARALPVRSRGALHHRPEHSRQRRRVHVLSDIERRARRARRVLSSYLQLFSAVSAVSAFNNVVRDVRYCCLAGRLLSRASSAARSVSAARAIVRLLALYCAASAPRRGSKPALRSHSDRRRQLSDRSRTYSPAFAISG